MTPATYLQVKVRGKTWPEGISPLLQYSPEGNSPLTIVDGPKAGKNVGPALDTFTHAADNGMVEVSLFPQTALAIESEVIFKGAAGDICHLLTALARGAMIPA
jgi:hypothetical protein